MRSQRHGSTTHRRAPPPLPPGGFPPSEEGRRLGAGVVTVTGTPQHMGMMDGSAPKGKALHKGQGPYFSRMDRGPAIRPARGYCSLARALWAALGGGGGGVLLRTKKNPA